MQSAECGEEIARNLMNRREVTVALELQMLIFDIPPRVGTRLTHFVEQPAIPAPLSANLSTTVVE